MIVEYLLDKDFEWADKLPEIFDCLFRTDIFFNIIQGGLIVLLIVSLCVIINQVRIDNELLETYDSCVVVNGERYCRVDE